MSLPRDEINRFAADFQELAESLRRAAPGQSEAAVALATVLFAEGHALLDGDVGSGKTRLVEALADAIEAKFRRLHLTPDLVAADVTGTYVVLESQGRRRFEMTQGPIFANVFLAEEIQRASPKTQAALLEAMSEGAVSLGNETYELPRPHLVVATRCPADDAGVFELPRVQLDRFMLSLSMAPLEEKSLFEWMRLDGQPVDREPILTADRVLEMASLAMQVELPESALRRISQLVLATRPDSPAAAPAAREHLAQGAGPRAALALARASRVRALSEGRPQVSDQDLRALAGAALRHRLALSYTASVDGVTVDDVLRKILDHAA